jgi:peptidoglycan/xylan/chitin deacetylase (PgdA/CDA1 family)
MRGILALIFVGAVFGQALAEETDCAYDPKLSHIARIVAADSTNGPIYGTALNDASGKAQSRTLNLRDHEVILTFDDGPIPSNTQAVLDTLQKHCVKATFFSVGRMAQANPKILQEIDARGHTIGTHTWSHPRAIHLMKPDDAKLEIEKGFAAVGAALGKPIAPWFRYPGLRDTPETVAYLASRNISVWSVDVIAGDTEPGATASRIASNVMNRLRPAGKGILLFHDIKKPTAEALDGILTELEKEGYKFVHVVSNTNYQPNPELIARADAFKTTPEMATITGRWAPSAKAATEEIKDGSVDVMHTEWVDLAHANDQLTGEADAEAAAVQPRAEAKQGAALTSNGWFVGDQIR